MTSPYEFPYRHLSTPALLALQTRLCLGARTAATDSRIESIEVILAERALVERRAA